MLTALIKLLVATLLRLHVPHRVVYAALSLGYALSVYGVSKKALSVLFTAAYLLLAVGS